MSDDKHKERIATLEKAIKDIEHPKSKWSISLEFIIACVVPFIFLLSILIANPSYFQTDDGSRNFRKIFIWFGVILAVCLVAFGGWYWYSGGKVVALF
jgi:hypothetical protein